MNRKTQSDAREVLGYSQEQLALARFYVVKLMEVRADHGAPPPLLFSELLRMLDLARTSVGAASELLLEPKRRRE